MAAGSFYVYALFDPREDTARPFYIGKGSGSRAYAHMDEEGEGRKNQRIRDIERAGSQVVVRQLVSGLAEADALRIEAQLIAAHGVIETGGCLFNRVVPTGLVRDRPSIKIPPGATEKAQLGLEFLKEAILEVAAANPTGVTNAQVVNHLGLHSDYNGEQKNYLSWSVLGILMREGRVARERQTTPRVTLYRYIPIGKTGVA